MNISKSHRTHIVKDIDNTGLFIINLSLFENTL